MGNLPIINTYIIFTCLSIGNAKDGSQTIQLLKQVLSLPTQLHPSLGLLRQVKLHRPQQSYLLHGPKWLSTHNSPAYPSKELGLQEYAIQSGYFIIQHSIWIYEAFILPKLLYSSITDRLIPCFFLKSSFQECPQKKHIHHFSFTSQRPSKALERAKLVSCWSQVYHVCHYTSHSHNFRRPGALFCISYQQEFYSESTFCSPLGILQHLRYIKPVLTLTLYYGYLKIFPGTNLEFFQTYL